MGALGGNPDVDKAKAVKQTEAVNHWHRLRSVSRATYQCHFDAYSAWISSFAGGLSVLIARPVGEGGKS